MNTVLAFLSGYYQYLELKVDPRKLVMGVPWYGYDYPCLSLSQVNILHFKYMLNTVVF